MPKDLNRTMLTGRLTRDPELRHTAGGMPVCSMRLAYTTSRKVQETGEWEDKSNYIDVTVWGRQGEVAAEHLGKGRRVAIDGRLEWREWEAQDGTKRQAYEVVAEGVIFLDFPSDDGGGQHPAQQAAHDEHDSYIPAGAGEYGSNSAAAGAASSPDDDIPF